MLPAVMNDPDHWSSRRRLVARLLVGAGLAAGLVLPVAARAQTAPSSTSPPASSSSAPPPVQDSRLSPALDAVAVASPAYDRAERGYTADWHRLGDAQARQGAADARLAQLAAAQASLTGDLDVAVRRHQKSLARLAVIRASLRTLAVALFVQGGPDPTGISVLDPANAGRLQTSQVMVETAGGNQLVDLSVNQAIVSSTHAQATTDLTSLSDVARRQGVAQGQRARALADQAAANAALARDRTQVADTRLTASVTGTDLSLVVLDAYWRAAAAMASSHPSCHLSWPVLAGIGHVESGNGTYGGDSVGAGGEEARPVIGVALDGTGGTQRITDTDGGTLDHDTTYDRAVGPMQVLPSAWRRYGVDGNGDGARDPQNLYDAAATAAVMLCRYGSLDTDAGLQTTFFHYNPSNAYVAEVLGYTHDYAAFTIPPVG